MRSYPKGVRNKVAFDLGTLLDDAFFPGAVAARRARSDEPHVGQLNSWVKDISAQTGKKVPFFDPRSGGVHARVLLLQQDPSEVAQMGSRMISRDNNDRTAQNTSRLCEEVGLAYEDIVAWNVVPWWVKDPDLYQNGRPRSLTGEAKLATPYVRELLELLAGVQKVLLMGKEAQAAWNRATAGVRIRAVDWRPCPHTSPLAYNQPHQQQATRLAFQWAAKA